jgi:phospholipid transport system transporter-binding protein
MIEFSDGRYRVQGPVTLATVEALLEEGERRFDGREIHVDLAGVTEADSSAVALLLAWARDAGTRGRRISFENLNENLRTLITLYEVGDLLPGA